MKLTKKKAFKGWNITCHLGMNTYTSWWTSPPKSVDNAGIEYLKDRYRCISTSKRMENFKKMYKMLMEGEGE